MTWMMWVLVIAAVALAVAVVNGFLAPLIIHLRTQPGQGTGADGFDPTPGAEFVGLALSGGGARAAIFAAAGMEALHRRGRLASVTHVSSVSGGGFAAAYLALNPVPEAAQSRAYFDKMQTALAHDFFWDTQTRQLRKPLRLFSPSRRLSSLQEALDRPDVLNAARMSDLPRDRAFFFNAVSYDTGQRFTFSNAALPPPDAASDHLLPAALRTLSFSDAAQDRVTPPSMPISLAVATSAAFPPYLGPMTIEVAPASDAPPQYWHLGDGGIVENAGVETLREAVYARGEGARATIYAFDAGKQLDKDLSRNTHNISIWSRDVTRLVDIITVYGDAHRKTLYGALDDKTGVEIDLITFNYMDVVTYARTAASETSEWLRWSAWTHATPADRLQSESPAEHLAKIPTALNITPCHRELIARAAEFLVQQRFPLDGGQG